MTIVLAKNQQVQDLYGLPSVVSFNVNQLLQPISKDEIFVCKKCNSKYSSSSNGCLICNKLMLDKKQYISSSIQKKQPIPLLFFSNLFIHHHWYAFHYLQLLKQYSPTKYILLLSIQYNKLVISTPHLDIVIPQNEWIINPNLYAFRCDQLTDDFITSYLNRSQQTNDIFPLLFNILTTQISQLLLFTSKPFSCASNIKSIRNKLYHSSSSFDQFVFEQTKESFVNFTLSKDCNSNYYNYTDITLPKFKNDCINHIKIQKLFNCRILVVFPGFEANEITPKSFVYSTDQTLSLFVRCKNDQNSFVNAQFQFQFTTDQGDCISTICTESFRVTNKLLQLYNCIGMEYYFINLFKYVLIQSHVTIEDVRNSFLSKLVDCMYNYYDIVHVSHFPFNSDNLSKFCCHLLNSPSLTGDYVQDINKDMILLKCITERHFEKNVHHYIYKESPYLITVFGDNWNELTENQMKIRWQEVMEMNASGDSMFFDQQLKSMKHSFNIVDNYQDLLVNCEDGMLYKYRDSSLFKINLLRRIEDKKKRSEQSYIIPHM
ncbi:Uncharacterized protein QTN25_007252 [Entamoeba marina]